MKKILFVVVALFVVNIAFSQDVKFGLKAGLNVAGLSDIEMSGGGFSIKLFEKDGMSVGFHAGAFANISFGDKIGFQPEFLFSMQGGKQKIGLGGLIESDEMNTKFSYHFNYVQVPLLLEIKPVANLGILIGPQLGYNLSRSVTISLNGMKETFSGSDFDGGFADEEDGNIFKKFDAGLAIGLQYTLMEKITIGARYNLGLTNSCNYSSTEDGIKVDMKGWKNNVFQLSVGILF